MMRLAGKRYISVSKNPYQEDFPGLGVMFTLFSSVRLAVVEMESRSKI